MFSFCVYIFMFKINLFITKYIIKIQKFFKYNYILLIHTDFKKIIKNMVLLKFYILYFLSLNFLFLFIFYIYYYFYMHVKNKFIILSYTPCNFNLFANSLLFLSLFVSVLSINLFDLKFKNKKFLYFFFLSFNVFLFIFLHTINFLNFFIFYELLLLPSTFLVFFSSPNIRSKNVSFYFLLWTQLGSFFVFLFILVLLQKTDNYCFSSIYYCNLTKSDLTIMSILLFVGFGIKIPVFPFHFWLTKTHVEANTGFSIFLSGILVKTALYGMYKFSFFFINCSFIYYIISFLSIIDVAIKIFCQSDLKKIVAYCTIFEMNIILVNFFFLNIFSYYFVILFCILHTILSCLFFFVVDCIFRRFNTRSIFGLNNLSSYYPILSFFIILSVLLFNGLPFSLKFNLELIFFSKLLSLNFLYFLIFAFVEVFFIIHITKFFFGVLFSFKKIKYTADLNLKEIFVFMILFSVNLYFCFL